MSSQPTASRRPWHLSPPGWLAALVALAVLAWYAVDQTVLGFAPWMIISHVALAWLLIPLGLCMVIGLLHRNRAGWVLAAVSLLAALPSIIWSAPAVDVDRGAGRPVLRVLSINLGGDDSRFDPHALAALIRSESPDVITLQECSEDKLGALMLALGGGYPHRTLLRGVWGYFDQVTLSRYPATYDGWTSRPLRLLRTRIEVNGRTVHVWNVHARRPEPLVEPDQDGEDTPVSAPVDQYIWLAGQVTRFETRNPGVPLVLAGDFNLPTGAAPWRLLTASLQDAQRHAGGGPGFTFPASADREVALPDRLKVEGIAGVRVPMPLTRLDHIFGNALVVFVDAQVLAATPGRDHAPVHADIVLR
jgi:vancomycin resistance protein VanJ